jgi:hypothetical protein
MMLSTYYNVLAALHQAVFPVEVAVLLPVVLVLWEDVLGSALGAHDLFHAFA